MSESNIGLYVVLGVVVAFAGVGMFMTFQNNAASQVVYVQEGLGARQAGPAVSYLPRLASAPFRIFGRGITGADVTQVGNSTVNFTQTIDLAMTKNTITCTAQLTQGATSAFLNTCNDNGGSGSPNPNSGGTIVCDSGTNKTNSTQIAACDGGFFLTNNGVSGKLSAFLNASSGPVNSVKTYVYNYTGCTANCTVALSSSPVTLNSTDQTLCNTFISGGSVCQCMTIGITSAANVLSAKSGTPVTFRKQDTVTTPATAC